VFKPGIMHRLLCPKCKVAFYVHVKRDLGVMLLREDEYKKMLCPSCKGIGRCPTCKGTGEMICPQCEGRGYYQRSRIYPCERCGGDDEECPQCKGRGYYEIWSIYSCERCGGDHKSSKYEEDFFINVTKGEIKLGRGRVWCSNCMGTGVCPHCGGGGLVFEHE
jgi:DnaJ-class molecular chaperone